MGKSSLSVYRLDAKSSDAKEDRATGGFMGAKSFIELTSSESSSRIEIARPNTGVYTSSMSLHRSLRSGGATAAKRNVLKRGERITLLKKRGLWKAGMKPTGLPKTKPE